MLMKLRQNYDYEKMNMTKYELYQNNGLKRGFGEKLMTF